MRTIGLVVKENKEPKKTSEKKEEIKVKGAEPEDGKVQK